mgnify:CR=1 FL=1
MNKLQKMPLMRPRASITAATEAGESWYSMRALSANIGELRIEGEIGAWGITAKQFAKDLKALGDVSQINMYVNSPGGEVFEGIAIYNMLKHHPANIDGTVGALAASMGSVILMAANTVNIPENAAIMIHKPWGIQGGDAEDMRRYAELLDQVEVSLVQAYVAKTGRTAEEIHALLDAETWMFGSEAVEAGFADKILEPLKAFAHIKSQRMQEFTNMPEAFKQLLTPRGSVTLPPVVVPPVNALAPVNLTPDQIRAQALADDTTRRAAISAAFSAPFAAAHAALKDTCLNDVNCTVETANAKLLAALGTSTTPTGSQIIHGHISNGNLVGDSVRASLASRVGQSEAQKDNAYNHMSLRELARASLQDRGILVATLAPMQMVGLSFTHDSSDFGNILLDIAGKSVLQGWDEAPETFDKWTKKGRLSDFKTVKRVGMGAFGSLREVRPGAEYKYITTGDRGEAIRLASYGELFGITRQAIINDDLDQLSTVPYNMGLAARATIGDLVYDVLTTAPKLSDTKALFDASLKNLFSGAGSAMSIEALSAAKTAMALQKAPAAEGVKGRTLNIRPAFVLVPVCLEDKANQLIRSASVPGATSNAGIDNPIRNFAEVIAEPRLDDASSTAWYLAAKQGTDTIEVAYLDGVEQPYIEQTQGFSVDGVVSKVRIDAGVAPLDRRGLNKSTGA